MTALAVSGALVGMGAGCGASATAPADAAVEDAPSVDWGARLCDGTPDELRLVATVVSDGGRLFFGEELMEENGWYLLVDAECRYWVIDTSATARGEVRTGSLDAETLGVLLEDFHYARWSALEGWYPSEPGVSHAPDIVFMDPDHSVVCRGLCGAEMVPADVQAMRDAMYHREGQLPRWPQPLWDEGTAVDGPVRIQVGKSLAPDPESYDYVPWPLTSIALHDIAKPVADGSAATYGDGLLIAGPDAATLRELRREYVNGEHGYWRRFIPIIDAEGQLYELYVRDVSPYENERGLLPWLHERSVDPSGP